MKPIFRLFSGALLLFLTTGANAANGPQPVMEEFMVPAVDPGISLYVRNKHPEGMSRFSADKIVLFVHGATYPAETAFDLRLNGVSVSSRRSSRWFCQASPTNGSVESSASSARSANRRP